VRLFLAINLPPDVRRELAAATADLRACAPEVAWVREPLLHLTLKFLDEQPDDLLRELQNAIVPVAGSHRELLMSIRGIGAFPNFRRARVVWIGVAQDPRLELLHHDVELACERLGFELEGRPFRPHVTLGRIKSPLPEARLRELSRAAKQTDYRSDFIVRSVDLMQSNLGPGGPGYTMINRAALRSD